jgi:hypothetical protein
MEELDALHGTTLSLAVDQETKLFYIEIWDRKMTILQSLKVTNKKYVDLNGVLMNSNLHLEEMTISWWSGAKQTIINHKLSSVNMLQQWKQLLGLLTNMEPCAVEVEQQIDASDFGILWLANQCIGLIQVVKYAT